ARAGADPRLAIHISDERDALLETGGGVRKARALLGEDPIWVANADYVWIEGGAPALPTLAKGWDPTRMDAYVLVVEKERTQGFDTPGDFFRDETGALTHRGAAASAPYHCFGVQILDPRPVYAAPETRFSLFQTWMAAAAEGRLFGYVPDGFWMQVGDPAALALAEARLARAMSEAS
ncbi:MAG: nucleotidyltransferase family protein, partial [Caulobacteraceae bacterium]|nr:nucleotidyltransferase family protein [Caulobacteraceae bacterium]